MHTRTRLVVFLVLHSPYEGLLQPVHVSRALLRQSLVSSLHLPSRFPFVLSIVNHAKIVNFHPTKMSEYSK